MMRDEEAQARLRCLIKSTKFVEPHLVQASGGVVLDTVKADAEREVCFGILDATRDQRIYAIKQWSGIVTPNDWITVALKLGVDIQGRIEARCLQVVSHGLVAIMRRADCRLHEFMLPDAFPETKADVIRWPYSEDDPINAIAGGESAVIEMREFRRQGILACPGIDFLWQRVDSI